VALPALTAVALLIQWKDDLHWFLVVAGLQGAVYGLAVWSAWRGPSSRRILIGIAAIALLMRVPIVCMPPYLSSDLYRYIWDGRVQAAGINPYRYVPADPHLEALRDADIFPQINRASSARTIYPPVAEAIFLAVTRLGETETVMKAAIVGFEIVTFIFLVRILSAEGLPTSRVLVYAWHPLPLWEFAGSGHLDAVLIAFVVVAWWAAQRHHFAFSGLALAGATLTKFYPAVLLPALYRRWGWTFPVTFTAAIIACYLPFVAIGWQMLGFLPGYAAEEGFDAGGTGFYLLSLLHQLPGLAELSATAYVIGGFLILCALGTMIFLNRETERPPFAPAALLATTFTVLVSPHYAWYFAWLIVFACFTRPLALLWLTNACLLLYLIPVGAHIVRDDHRLVVESIIYAPFAALAVADLCYYRKTALPE
jgi:hypothetical protein